MPMRGGSGQHSPFNKACDKIRRTAERVYRGNLGKIEGCKRMVDEIERLVDREDHTPGYNPYQTLANRLKENWPEVWEGDEHNGGQRALAPWRVS